METAALLDATGVTDAAALLVMETAALLDATGVTDAAALLEETGVTDTAALLDATGVTDAAALAAALLEATGATALGTKYTCGPFSVGLDPHSIDPTGHQLPSVILKQTLFSSSGCWQGP